MKMKLWATVLALAVLGAACKKDGGAVDEPAPAPAGPDAWFQYIPADAPLVVANLRPLPESFVNWLAGSLEPVAGVLQQNLTATMEETSDEQERAVLAELDGKLSREGLAEIGFSLTPRFAVYTIGLSLAMRIELADGQRLRAFIERLEAAAGQKLDRAVLEGIDYMSATDEDATFVLAIPGNELIVGVMHPAAREQVLPVLLGVQRPESSLADTGALPAIVDQYGLMGVSTGYFDTGALVRMLTGRASALSNAVVSATWAELPQLSATCHQELDGLAAIVPRLVFGYTAIQERSFEALGVLEMREDVARDLAGLQLPVQGLDDLAQVRPLFAFGAGLDLDRALVWLQGKAQGVVDAPYRCEALGDLNQYMGELAQQIQGSRASMPPFLSGFRGLSLMVTELQLGGLMPAGAGFAMLGVSHPMGLLEMAKSFVPALANVSVEPGGPPVAVATGTPGLDPVYVAVQGSWLGAAVGAGMDQSLAGRLRAEPAAGGPFMVFAYDYGKLVGALEQAGELGSDDEAKIMKAVASVLGFSMASFRFDERGLVTVQSVQGR